MGEGAEKGRQGNGCIHPLLLLPSSPGPLPNSSWVRMTQELHEPGQSCRDASLECSQVRAAAGARGGGTEPGDGVKY